MLDLLFQNQSCIDLCASQDGMRGRMMVGVGLVFFQQVMISLSTLIFSTGPGGPLHIGALRDMGCLCLQSKVINF